MLARKFGSSAFSEQSAVSHLRTRVVDGLVERLLTGLVREDRACLAEAITLIETTNLTKQRAAQQLLTAVLQLEKERVAKHGKAAQSFRIGISGPPGAGKSTFLEAIGSHLTENGHKVGCLTVDPSSRITGGSLLGDKTRMPNLSRNPRAFIRPSPTSGILGGVTRTTSEAILLLEAAGFDIVFVETVGSGQNEYVVADMVDMFVLVIPPSGGDELQAVKRGIMELSHLVLVNKADGDLVAAARRTQAEYISALKFMTPNSTSWTSKVQRMSSVTGEGVKESWTVMLKFREASLDSAEFTRRRAQQNSLRMWRMVDEHLRNAFHSDPEIGRLRHDVENNVHEGRITPLAGALSLIDSYNRKR